MSYDRGVSFAWIYLSYFSLKLWTFLALTVSSGSLFHARSNLTGKLNFFTSVVYTGTYPQFQLMAYSCSPLCVQHKKIIPGMQEYVRERGEGSLRNLEQARRECQDRERWKIFCRGHPLVWALRSRRQNKLNWIDVSIRVLDFFLAEELLKLKNTVYMHKKCDTILRVSFHYIHIIVLLYLSFSGVLELPGVEFWVAE